MTGILNSSANAARQDAVSQAPLGLVIDGLDCSVPSEAYVRRLRAGGVDCMHLSIEDMDGRGNVHPFVFVYERLDELRDSLRLARSVTDILECKRQGKIALVLGWQGADPVGVEPGTLRAYYELGLRIVGITYNTTNRYGAGCLDPTGRLSEEGRALVRQAQALNMLVDVGGHTGEQTSLDVIESSEGRPVICSHTAMSALNPNRRNTSDRVCEAIARTGGVVGVLCLSDFLVRNASNSRPDVASPQATLQIFLDHLDYLKRLVGIDHIGLGPDFVDGQNLELPGAWRGTRIAPDMVGPLSAAGSIVYAKGFESIDELPGVVTALRERGWSQSDLSKLLGENWARVYRTAWGR